MLQNGFATIFKRPNWFQWEQNRYRHSIVDADAWCKRALMKHKMTRQDKKISAIVYKNESSHKTQSSQHQAEFQTFFIILIP